MGYNNDFKNNSYNNQQNNNFDPNYGNQNRNVIQPRRYDQRSANSFNDDLPFIDDTSEYQKSVIKNNQSSAQIEYQKKLQRYSQFRLENENNYQNNYQNNWNQGNYNYPQNYYQETMDFEKPISYGNYDYNPYEPVNNNLNYYNQSSYYQAPAPVQVPRQTNYAQEALDHQNNGSCDVPGCEFNQSESSSKSNSSQPTPAPLGNNQNYNPGGNMPNFAPDYSWNNQFDKKEKLEYSKQYSKSQIIPKQILKEIFLEKTRVALLIIFGLVGLITTSIFTAAYFEAKRMGLSLSDPNQKIWGIPTVNIPYPFWMISIMIISLSLFLIGLADLLFLNANVKKYEKDLRLGYENVPYFITKNYRAIIARAVYLNWIAFTSYVLMSIVLGILYGMQTAFESGKTDIYLFFWKIGNFKNFTSEITVTITCLLTVLGIHIANIVFTKIRKNNLISYYGYEILPPDEIRTIKRGANKRCMIIFFVTLFTILFVIVIPIIIIKKKKGVPFRWPWQMLN